MVQSYAAQIHQVSWSLKACLHLIALPAESEAGFRVVGISCTFMITTGLYIIFLWQILWYNVLI